MSTRCITWPPSSLPSALVCAGSTTSAISDREALTGLPGGKFSELFLIADCLRLIELRSDLYLGPSLRVRIIRDAMTEPKKTRRQMLEEFVAKKPDDAFSRYGLAMECMNTGDTAAANEHFQALLQGNADYV